MWTCVVCTEFMYRMHSRYDSGPFRETRKRLVRIMQGKSVYFAIEFFFVDQFYSIRWLVGNTSTIRGKEKRSWLFIGEIVSYFYILLLNCNKSTRTHERMLFTKKSQRLFCRSSSSAVFGQNHSNRIVL